MGNIIIVGAQWGDEGKGKVTDEQLDRASVDVRFQGGNNAGHTLVIDGVKYVTHTLPSGIVRAGMLNLVGPGVVCDLEVIRDELKISAECGSRVLLDHSASVIMPFHREIDAARERALGKDAIGTTARGIGPTYEDFYGRRGPMLDDLMSEDRIVDCLQKGDYFGGHASTIRHFGGESMCFDETVAWFMQFADEFTPLLVDTRAVIAEYTVAGKRILFEGAQGVGLDVYHGTWPCVTSSTCTAAGVSQTLGIYNFEDVIGVTKAYVTRVGAGPFPTECHGEHSEELRRVGKEFGATTGRPRRCGRADWVHLRYACRVGGITKLVLTKADILTGMGPIEVCTSYTRQGKQVNASETLTHRVLSESTPEYTTFQGWTKDLSECRAVGDLPPQVLAYVKAMEAFVGVPVAAISVGPDRSQIVPIPQE